MEGRVDGRLPLFRHSIFLFSSLYVTGRGDRPEHWLIAHWMRPRLAPRSTQMNVGKSEYAFQPSAFRLKAAKESGRGCGVRLFAQAALRKAGAQHMPTF